MLDFTNRSFQEFVMDCTGGNIFDEKYNYDSGSKANRLRAFWTTEPNELVAKLLRGGSGGWPTFNDRCMHHFH